MCHLLPTGRNREGEATSSKRSSAICFSSRSRPSLHHLAWKCVMRRHLRNMVIGATRPSCWFRHRRGQGNSYRSALAGCRQVASAAARAPHAATAVQRSECSACAEAQRRAPARLAKAIARRRCSGDVRCVHNAATMQPVNGARGYVHGLATSSKLLFDGCNEGLHKEGRVQRTHVYMYMYYGMAEGVAL